MDKTCYYKELIAIHSGQEEAHKKRRKMAANGHRKGSSGSHNRMEENSKME